MRQYCKINVLLKSIYKFITITFIPASTHKLKRELCFPCGNKRPSEKDKLILKKKSEIAELTLLYVKNLLYICCNYEGLILADSQTH